MTTRELRNLQSTLMTTPTQGARAQRLASRQANRVANDALYLQSRENRGRRARNRRSQRAYMEGRSNQANYRLNGYQEVQNTHWSNYELHYEEPAHSEYLITRYEL